MHDTSDASNGRKTAALAAAASADVKALSRTVDRLADAVETIDQRLRSMEQTQAEAAGHYRGARRVWGAVATIAATVGSLVGTGAATVATILLG